MKALKGEVVAVLGASNKTHRYSYRALKMLQRHGHEVIPVHPRLDEIDGIKVVHTLKEITQCVNTLTLYIGPEHSRPLIDQILELKPERIIFNPGTASTELEARLKTAGIPYSHDCTLVMLQSGHF